MGMHVVVIALIKQKLDVRTDKCDGTLQEIYANLHIN
jgi:hypothetical protein